MYRAYIALGKYDVVMDEINISSKQLLSIRLVAEYFTIKENRNVFMERFDELFNKSGLDLFDEQSEIIDEAWKWSASVIYYSEGMFENVLK